MSKAVVWVAALSLALVTGRAESSQEKKPETLVRWHFAGSKALAENRDLPALQQVLALPETGTLRDAAVEKIALAASTHFAEKGSTNPNPAAAALIKPLLPDLFQSETRLELATKAAADADWAFAIRLPEDRVAAWNKNLGELAKMAGMTTSPQGDGWSATLDKYRLSFSRNKEWILLEGGFGPADSNSKFLKSFRNSLGKKAGKEVLQAEVNFPLLGKIWSAPALQHSPKLTLEATPRNKGLRTEGQIEYPQDLKITPEPWKIPAEVIKEPIVSFTALQGVREKLARSSYIQELGAEKIPNQLFLWTLDEGPFALFLAGEVGNPKVVVSNVVARLIPQIKHSPGGTIEMATNRSAALWRGLPVVVPFVEPAPAPDSTFLVSGLFPLAGYGTNKAPAELFAQLKKKNLIYYDWEVVPARIEQWRVLWQLAKVLQGKLLPPRPSDAWLQAAGPRLGNTVTEATLDGSRRLKLVRQSQLGFSALELTLLAHLTDSKDEPRPQGKGTRRNTRPAPALPAPGAQPPAK